MGDSVILAGFSGMELVDFHFHIDWESWSNNSIELKARKGSKGRHLLFHGVSKLRFEEGFNGSLSGMVIMDISNRMWDSARIEVRNVEQDPGITFLAHTMEIIDDDT